MSDPDTSADFIIRINAGTSSAIEQAVNRYRDRLCQLVAHEMGRRLAAREEPDDAVDSALASFCLGVKELRFRFDHSGAMWKLLETITRHKMLHHIEHEDANIRNADHEAGPVAEWTPDREPSPEDAVQISDLIEKAIEGLEPPDPEIFRLHLEGHTRAELAARFDCTEAKIRAKVDRIRARLKRLLSKDQR